EDSFAYERLKERATKSSLADAFYSALERRGFSAPAIGNGNSTESEAHYGRRTQAVLEILTHFEERYEEFQLSEALMEHDEYFALSRSSHLKLLEHVLGH